eukprot:CAMPEP_0171912782 /NCGR_PEP_ID=MMETSP0993-20121228/11358_1 /TAXON_ID=483369 /ORGANISM="non described non described, Strain CCMP2098" /LENGTH=436 /DNA_ID=CAMNT_0012546689 /DNA_START=3 /DNA_END=1313 /DNA_ORIENTATION=+
MSLGWNTESALLPSKAKPILGLDSRSLLDLQAIVSEKEEERSKKKRAGESFGDDHEQQLRQRRGAGAVNVMGGPGTDRDVFSRANTGVAGRQAADAEALNLERARKRGRGKSGILERKAELYERLKRGDVASEDAKKAGFLVDFETNQQHPSKDQLSSLLPVEFSGGGGGAGRHEEYNGSGGSCDSFYPEETSGSDEVEVEDEFGRMVVVRRGSEEHRDYLARKRAEAAEQAAEVTRQQQEEDAAAAAAVSKAKSGGSRDHIADNQRQIPSNPLRSQKGHQLQQQQWPVSNGARREDCGEWASTADEGGDERSQEGQGLRDFYDDLDDLPSSSAARGGGVGGGVKSRWDQTLSARDKGYLKEVIAEGHQISVSSCSNGSVPMLPSGDQREDSAEAGAAGANKISSKNQRRDPKAERRELLRKKAEARELKKARGAL